MIRVEWIVRKIVDFSLKRSCASGNTVNKYGSFETPAYLPLKDQSTPFTSLPFPCSKAIKMNSPNVQKIAVIVGAIIVGIVVIIIWVYSNQDNTKGMSTGSSRQGKHTPITDPFSESVYSSQQPAFSSQQPAFSSQQPAFSSQQPAFSNQQPAFSNQQPAFSNQQPDFSNQPPVFHFNSETVDAEESTVHVEEVSSMLSDKKPDDKKPMGSTKTPARTNPQPKAASSNDKKQSSPQSNSQKQPDTTTQQTRQPDIIDGPEGEIVVSQMPVKSMAKFVEEVQVNHDATVLLQPLTQEVKKSPLQAATANNEESVSLDQILSAEYVSIVKHAQSSSQNIPFNLPVGTLTKILRKSESDAMKLLLDESFEVLEFYWECMRTGWIYKYLNGHYSEFSQDLEKVRELLIHALTKNPSAEHKAAIEAAIAKLHNPYQPLISHLQKNPQVQHINGLSPELVQLLKGAASVDIIQSPPELNQRVKTLYEELKLKRRIYAFLKSDAAEITDQVEEDAKEAVAIAAHLGLTDQQVKSLRSLLSN